MEVCVYVYKFVLILIIQYFVTGNTWLFMFLKKKHMPLVRQRKSCGLETEG